MIRTFSLVSVTALLVAMAASQPAMARGIKDYMSDSDLAAYCATAGVDTHTQTSVTLKDNSVVSGTVHCEAEDLIVGSDDVNDAFDDSDGRLDDDGLDDGSDDSDDAFDDSDDRDDSDSDGSEHDGGDDSSNDDSDDSDDSSDDSSGDDHGGDRDGDRD